MSVSHSPAEAAYGAYGAKYLHLFRSKPSRITQSKDKWTGQPGT